MTSNNASQANKYAGLLFNVEEYIEIAPFRFPVYNDITPGEARKIRELQKTNTDIMEKTFKLAKRISEEEGIEPEEAYELLGRLSNDDKTSKRIIFKYMDEVNRINNSQGAEVDELAAYCTVIIQMRGEVLINGEWVKTDDWTQAQTDNVPTQTLKAIQNYMLTEINQGQAPDPNLPAPAPGKVKS